MFAILASWILIRKNMRVPGSKGQNINHKNFLNSSSLSFSIKWAKNCWNFSFDNKNQQSVQSPRFKSFGSSRISLNPTLSPNLIPNSDDSLCHVIDSCKIFGSTYGVRLNENKNRPWLVLVENKGSVLSLAFIKPGMRQFLPWKSAKYRFLTELWKLYAAWIRKLKP